MNKTELIAEVAKKCGMSKKDAEKAVTTTFDTITEALSQGDKVQLVGFGGFETKKPSRFRRPLSPSSRPARRSRKRPRSNLRSRSEIIQSRIKRTRPVPRPFRH